MNTLKVILACVCVFVLFCLVSHMYFLLEAILFEVLSCRTLNVSIFLSKYSNFSLLHCERQVPFVKSNLNAYFLFGQTECPIRFLSSVTHMDSTC